MKTKIIKKLNANFIFLACPSCQKEQYKRLLPQKKKGKPQIVSCLACQTEIEI